MGIKAKMGSRGAGRGRGMGHAGGMGKQSKIMYKGGDMC